MKGAIRHLGPIGLDRFMAEAVQEYYALSEPFGQAGDFTTAPEISQMFGELLGLWAVDTWHRLGRPAPFLLVELGPGRGTLMADALRAARLDPAFSAALTLHLVETSPRLRAIQAERLSAAEPTFHAAIETLPPGPMILIANEFFDALPIRQFERRSGGWHERLVMLDAEDQFRLGLSPDPAPVAALLGPLVRAAPVGGIAEISAAGRAVAGTIATRLVQEGGAALILDYGMSCRRWSAV